MAMHLAEDKGNFAEHLLKGPAAAGWEKLGVRQHHGICLPLASLRKKEGSGIGEYLDLLPVIDWCKKVGMDIIQLLPMNDPGIDQSPYNPVSAFALSPLHLSLYDLPWIDEAPPLKGKIKEPIPCDALDCVDYSAVREAKSNILSAYVEHFSQRWQADPSLQSFVAGNPWLTGYTAFMVLKELHSWCSWEDWPQEQRHPTPQLFAQLQQEHSARWLYHQVVQLLCHQQMRRVHDYATTAGVFIKGDIPILISRDSADVWEHRHLFHLEVSAGAPPDQYATDGQNWGFPLYRWSALESEGYQWWRARLQVNSLYYHLYRLDHVVGFFRIWAIPPGKSGRDGYFVPSEESTWIAHGEKILRVLLASAPILPIGEDLGVIPNGVRDTLSDLGICGMKVMRWERDWHKAGHPYFSVDSYPKESLTTVSTHDAEPLRLWWQTSPEEAHAFCAWKGWSYVPTLMPDMCREILHMSHQSSSLFHVNLLLEYMSLFPELSWPDPQQDRINIPGKILKTNWAYRLRPTIDEWTGHERLQEAIHSFITPVAASPA